VGVGGVPEVVLLALLTAGGQAAEAHARDRTVLFASAQAAPP
jgi:hypothetical protein